MAEPLPPPEPLAESAGLALGIDTAAARASLALLRGDEVVAQHAWTIETTASLELLAALDALLRDAGVDRRALASIAVVAGPGQYGGLRAGVATAQGLALGLDVPLAGVARLEADALPLLDRAHLEGARPVVAVHDAGRGALAWAVYAAGYAAGVDGAPVCLVAPRLDAAEVVAREAPRPAIWCGELNEALLAARDAEHRSGDTVAEPSAGGRAASAVRLARLHAAYGDPAGVDAIYLRPPSITAPRPRP